MTEQTCKCCGQTLPQPLAIETLKGRQRQLVDAVWKSGQHGIDFNQLLHVAYGDDPEGGPLWASTSLRVRLRYINKNHLIPHGYMIKSSHTGGGAFGRYRIMKYEQESVK